MNFLKKALLASACVALASGAAMAADIKKDREALAQTFPHLTITEFNPSPISGIYEVVAGDQIIYYSPEGYLMFGEIWSADGKSLTADRQAALASKKLESLPLDKAIKIGNGPNVVIEFTDPNCPYCKRGKEFFDARDDVTRYVFLFPVQQDSPAAIQYILCSNDRPKALQEAYTGRIDPSRNAFPPFCNGEALMQEHIRVAQSLGVRGTPAYWINGSAVSGADFPKIESLLNK
ncbi:DsbC family protein [Geoalkalibacter halelectricus]|uniref:DsbC family protein n=1 Tax=Geoalkalibacter halelectricus TaxID=2847045 RepID=UPI0026703B14|nr:DsbC family protein [Geoalkalibacter halelectricus]MDO3380359.1 DsbC family protein [Geoalkalibacter halelectricus]